MKEMTYLPGRVQELLHSGEYSGHRFAIVNQGTHPVAYVECKIKGIKNYDDDRLDEIDVHGGFTYFGACYWAEPDRLKYLGWDYAHYMDFIGHLPMLPSVRNGKMWTTSEIYEEVKSVIDQLCVVEKKRVTSNEEPVAYLQRVLTHWGAFCKGHPYFERAIRSILLENETLKQRIKELEN